ncbi:MAG: hypothetical protein J7485_09650 [Sphingobium sp.]|nr:hypothetical protein [Sphingobium sp.]
MATAAQPTKSLIERERAFFFIMAIAMAIVIVAGFAFNLAAGRSSFAVPLVYHVHAFIFFGWVVLYLLQNGLVATGSVALHRRLGWLALIWLPAMLVLGVMMPLQSARTTGGPPFLALNEFLFGTITGVVTFVITALLGIALRGRTDWHRRIMCGAMASITGPGFGRLMPMPLLIPWGWWISSVIVPMVFVIVGMVADRRRSGKVHPAWLAGAVIFVGGQLIASAVAYSPAGLSITRSVVEGTPGATREMQAHFP